LPHPQTFSVISLEPARVSITGARWDLDQVQLEPLSTLGLSNELLPKGGAGDAATVKVHAGAAFVICS